MAFPPWIQNPTRHSSTRGGIGRRGIQGHCFSWPLSSGGSCPGSYSLSGVEHAAPATGVFSWVRGAWRNQHSSFVDSWGQSLSPLDYTTTGVAK